MMKKITALRMRRGGKKRVNIFLDGGFAFSLEAEVVVKGGLRVGQELSETWIKELTESDNFQRCFNAAAIYLTYRPRSESEIRDRLHQHGFNAGSVEAVITKLKEQCLVNDMAFARFWKDNRESFSPRSRWLTKLELQQKGVADRVINQVVDEIDDGDSAYRAAINKAFSLHGSDYQTFRRRLGGHLRRRGFNYGIIKHTIERLWREQRSSA